MVLKSLAMMKEAYDGYKYTLDEFIWWYGYSWGVELWESAGVEMRIAYDGYKYTLDDFIWWYGRS